MARKRSLSTNLFQPGTLVFAALCLMAGIWLGHLRNNIPASHPQANSSLKVYFSPDGGATRELVRLISAARKSVEVQAYSFTSKPVIKALIHAKDRGVDVEIILDRSNVERKNYRTHTYHRLISAGLDAVYTAGIPTYIDDRYLIAHNKVMLIDGQTLITGSFNFSYAAAHFNAENMLVIKNIPSLIEQYQKNFEFHEKTSQRYKPGLVLKHQFHFPHYH
jgi:phosphatidylserine/phosphatidylglycerophosphate/cardiolipin synthase-like enzyme